MEPNEAKLQEMKGKAQAKFDEISRAVLDGDHSLTQYLVRAYRNGHDPAKATAAFDALEALLKDARATYTAAIAQPEPKISVKSRVAL